MDAKELDVLRFRAPEAINAIIYRLGHKYDNTYLVNSKELFDNMSPGKVTDNSLFTDHLHPNLDGFFLIASAFYNEIMNTGILGRPDHRIPADSIKKEIPVTPVDSVYGSLVILFMKEEWPFLEPASFDKYKAKSYPEILGIRMFLKQINWEMAMDSLYRYYLKNSNFPEAIKVAKSVCLEHPYESRLSEEVGQLYLNLGIYHESRYYYKKAFEINPSIENARKMVLILMQLDNLEESARYLQYLAKREPNDQMNKRLLEKVGEVTILKKKALSNPEDIGIQTSLAGFYLYIGNLPVARMHLEKALTIDPSDKISRLLMNELHNQEASRKKPH
jgi:tetratricopeptide (TPR) repeat protein